MTSLRIYALGISFLTLISLIFLSFILIKIDPFTAKPVIFVLFYASFFVALAGLFSLAGFCLRRIIIKNHILVKLFKTSFKQGILIAIILTGLLFSWTLLK